MYGTQLVLNMAIEFRIQEHSPHPTVLACMTLQDVPSPKCPFYTSTPLRTLEAGVGKQEAGEEGGKEEGGPFESQLLLQGDGDRWPQLAARTHEGWAL